MTTEINRAEAACFSGHRDISINDTEKVAGYVADAIATLYSNGYRVFFCGGARGFDTIAAREVIRFRTAHSDVRLIIAVPCVSQADKWPEDEQTLYRTILDDADEVITLSEKYYNGCMQRRNRFMVDHSSLCLCYLIRFKGGTWSTVRYALHEGLTVRNLAMRDSENAGMREKPWNYMYTYHSAQKNANTVRLYHSLQEKSRRMNTLKCLSGRRRSGKKSLTHL